MDLLGIQWPQIVFVDVFQCHRAAPAMLRFAGVTPSDQLISFAFCCDQLLRNEIIRNGMTWM